MKKPYKLLSVVLLGIASHAAFADLDITVTGGRIAPKPIAIVPFDGAPAAPVDVAQVVEDDLVRSGQFVGLKRSDMLEKPSDKSQVDYRNWRATGREAIVVGAIRQDGASYIERFSLLDVGSQTELGTWDVPAMPSPQLRRAGHIIADLIYEKLTGVRGYFDTQIAYITASGMGNSRIWQLIVADSDGENSRVIASSHEPLMSPAWAPDRSRLSYVGYDHGHSAIYLHTLATGELKKFVFEKGINGAPAWSPDGHKLAVTLSFETNPDIYVIDLLTGSRKRLTESYGIDTEPSWSPDGASIIFTSDRGGSAQIYQAPAEGGPAKRLTFQGKQNLRASYSPDGKSLVVVNNDGGYRIGIFDLATGNMRIISDGPLDEGPSFAPNGAIVIYTRSGGRGSELATATTDGYIHRSLTQVGSEVREPAWSPFLH